MDVEAMSTVGFVQHIRSKYCQLYSQQHQLYYTLVLPDIIRQIYVYLFSPERGCMEARRHQGCLGDRAPPGSPNYPLRHPLVGFVGL